MKFIPLLLILAWAVSGCSTTLHTYDTDKNEMKGVPVPKPQLVKVITTTLYEAIDGATWPDLCSKNQIDESYDYIASGEHYYVNFDPSEFAKGTFELNFNDKGLLSKVSVNSEANTGVDSTVGALGAILPFFKATKAEELAAKSAQSAQSSAQRATDQQKTLSAAEKKAESCVIKSKKIKLQPLQVK